MQIRTLSRTWLLAIIVCMLSILVDACWYLLVAGCGTPGFETSSGWDPVSQSPKYNRLLLTLNQVTGLGTPQFDVLLQAAFAAHGGQPPIPPPSNGTPHQLDATGSYDNNNPFARIVVGNIRLDAFIGIIAGGIFGLILIFAILSSCCQRSSRKTAVYRPHGYGSASYQPLHHPAPLPSNRW